MGNIVTNRVNFERRDGAVGVEGFADLIARITPRPLAEFAADLAAADSRRTSAEVPFDMGLVSPLPKALAGDERGEIILGLALLSTEREDLVMALWESRDPIFNDMPPNMVMTAYTVLVENGIAGLDAASRRDLAERDDPDMRAARAALAAYRETGKFDAVSWQTENWGTRAHAGKADVWIEDGNLCLAFDTKNSGPDAWIEKLADTLPSYHFSGASYDEDMDYSLHFVTEEPGEVSIEESHDEDRLLDARAFVSGMTTDELRSMWDDENDDPEM